MEEILRLSGFLVRPGEIEERLSSHPAVELAKVVGITDSDGHSMPIAFVTQVAGREVSAGELIDWCASAIAKYKVPRVVHLVRDLPTTAGTNGSKIRTKDLRDLAQREWDEEAARRRAR
jgi:fatty-acyl-CoA synthase